MEEIGYLGSHAVLCVQALQLVSDVHLLADQVRSKCGYKESDRTLSGTLTPRFSAIQENDNQVRAPSICDNFCLRTNCPMSTRRRRHCIMALSSHNRV